MAEKSIKAVVVGDGAVGKTCLCISYTQNKFPDGYVPTVFDNYNTKLEVDKTVIDLNLWDVSGQEDYERIRPVAYPNANAFMMCFSLVNPTNLENIENKWMSEIRNFCPEAPFVLIGTKSDLRDDWENILTEQKDPNGRPITWAEGDAFAKKIGAAKYIECSAKMAKNIQEVFEETVRIALNPPAPPKKAEEPTQEAEGKCCRIM
ncbi:RAS-related protein racG, putative [Trichomonas vaginalis G3]|uniref:RAS-related protein racG, putative n=1 Tax=Trichomonas vaginalis (strain ATCC PRA-98 / G3) TaxID=412133 RepID=A2FQU7_TRIV3|nr:small GTPase mediated signal transduction [Trichomonas vaginalis G3]EAX92716.1 RAS-related protein racG, putative [Trichomonas vaginalis G3]KAI5517974.1 small GTPase mediated signal transduction [Trichomonas vaginalis G3]|eukprot:XP_001305646.1 RAS-related protein racG [Trichomonas vaginalis G3]